MPEKPPYLRIADVLRQRIADQEWTAGDRLPSRAQIAEECGVGENVVRRAQELLISQGVLGPCRFGYLRGRAPSAGTRGPVIGA